LRFHRRRHPVVSTRCFTGLVRVGMKIPKAGTQLQVPVRQRSKTVDFRYAQHSVVLPDLHTTHCTTPGTTLVLCVVQVTRSHSHTTFYKFILYMTASHVHSGVYNVPRTPSEHNFVCTQPITPFSCPLPLLPLHRPL